jgi:hypothetical protein
MLGVGIIFACTVCALLGVTAGINMNPQATVKFVPDWGSLADWVSGIGSVSAALVALYLADRQRRDNTARIEINQYLTQDNFSIDLVSTGEKPAIVTGIYIRSPRLKKQALINRTPVPRYSETMGRYEYGETRRLSLDSSMYLSLALEIEHELGCRDFSGLQLIVGTGIAEFRKELNADFAKLLYQEAVNA